MPGQSSLPADCVNLSAIPGIHVFIEITSRKWRRVARDSKEDVDGRG